jgi:hypothetical protein
MLTGVTRSTVETDLRLVDICSREKIEIVSENVEGDTGDDFFDFA